jgi:hypothetical protein
MNFVILAGSLSRGIERVIGPFTSGEAVREYREAMQRSMADRPKADPSDPHAVLQEEWVRTTMIDILPLRAPAQLPKTTPSDADEED